VEEDLTEAFTAPFLNEVSSAPDYASSELSWMESNSDQPHGDSASVSLPVEEEKPTIGETSHDSTDNEEPAKAIEAVFSEKGIASAEDEGGIPSDVLERLKSPDTNVREAALAEVVRVGGDDAFRCISRAFDDQSVEVRNAAARALFDLHADRAATFTRALREGTPERRRSIGHALAASGLAKDAIGNLTGESREKTYDAFSLLFLMAKAGEVQPLMQAIEDYPNVEVRIAVVKLLALSGQPDIVPAFRRMAVRGSLPSEVRSAVMEAIYQIGNQARESAPSAA
jgi:HEAT repeat protein